MTKQIAWNTGSGNITLTYQGQGDGAITIGSDPNDLGNERSQAITIETTAGSPVVTRNLTVRQAACPFPVGDVRNFTFTNDVRSVILPAGKYKLQCWGAQGGTCSDGYSGGKGGYSEGVLTLTSPTTVYIFVGGQGGQSGNGGWNGGGGGSGSSSYNSGNEYGSSTFGCGGGATDIALVTSSMSYSSYRNNRSSASLLSRMIVAGGGSGGAYGYQEYTEEITEWETVDTFDGDNGASWFWSDVNRWSRTFDGSLSLEPNTTYRWITDSGTTPDEYVVDTPDTSGDIFKDSDVEFTTENRDYSGSTLHILFYNQTDTCVCRLEKKTTSSSTTTNSDSQVGYVGGGTNGGGYSSTYYGRQNRAGSNGSFGLGANQTVTNYRYGAGCGGGGWYGGGNSYSDNGLSTIRQSGGGSGFVNTAANASYRPSGYTGLQLDSGTTKAGDTSFPSTSGGTETGHSGNGYARITRLT